MTAPRCQAQGAQCRYSSWPHSSIPTLLYPLRGHQHGDPRRGHGTQSRERLSGGTSVCWDTRPRALPELFPLPPDHRLRAGELPGQADGVHRRVPEPGRLRLRAGAQRHCQLRPVSDPALEGAVPVGTPWPRGDAWASPAAGHSARPPPVTRAVGAGLAAGAEQRSLCPGVCELLPPTQAGRKAGTGQWARSWHPWIFWVLGAQLGRPAGWWSRRGA